MKELLVKMTNATINVELTTENELVFTNGHRVRAKSDEKGVVVFGDMMNDLEYQKESSLTVYDCIDIKVSSTNPGYINGQDISAYTYDSDKDTVAVEVVDFLNNVLGTIELKSNPHNLPREEMMQSWRVDVTLGSKIVATRFVWTTHEDLAQELVGDWVSANLSDIVTNLTEEGEN